MNKNPSRRILSLCLSLVLIASVPYKALSAGNATQIHQQSISTRTGEVSSSSRGQFYKRTNIGIAGEMKLSHDRVMDYNSKISMPSCSMNSELQSMDQVLNRKIMALSSTIESNLPILKEFETYYRNQNIIGGINNMGLIMAVTAGVIIVLEIIAIYVLAQSSYAAYSAGQVSASSLYAQCNMPIPGVNCLFTFVLSPIWQGVEFGTGFTEMPLVEAPLASDPNNRALGSIQDVTSRLTALRMFENNFQDQVEKIYSERVENYHQATVGDGLFNYLARVLRNGHYSSNYVSAAFSKAISNEMLRLYLLAQYIDLREQTSKLCEK